MSRNSSRIPSYRLHKPTGQAVVTLDSRDHYLGRHGSPASKAEYDRLVREWLASGRHRPPAGPAAPGLTVDELILRFWHHAKKHYRHPNGEPTGELDNYRDALHPLRRLYGPTQAGDFGPLNLRAVREDMVKSGLARTTVNARVNRVRRVFRWAASMELIPVSIVQALATVPGLLRGRCDVPEAEGVRPVSWADVEATLPYLPRPVAAMVQLMRHSNCRAEDAVVMRGCDLNREGDVWSYRPEGHKNAWRGHERLIYLGVRAQEVLQPFLRSDPAAYLFSPRDALEEHHARRRALRKTKRTPSELRRRRKQDPRWMPGVRYNVNNFQQAVRRACRRAKVPEWSVLQVRHTRATEVRERYGVEGAQVSLGNARVETAQIYAEKNQQLARQIAQEIG